MTDSRHPQLIRNLVVIMFAVAMAYVEAAVVFYLRGMFYPEGFAFPLKELPRNYLLIEFFRELSTVVMLTTAAYLAGRKFWPRFGFFIVLFGIWDIFYYVWLKVMLGWPASLFDWDILFLIPVPWVGPVIAPVLVSLLMVIAGLMIVRLYDRGYKFRPGLIGWVLALTATGLIFYSFIRQSGVVASGRMPENYSYALLAAGLALYTSSFYYAYRKTRRHAVHKR